MGGGILALAVGTAMTAILATGLVLEKRNGAAQRMRNVTLAGHPGIPFTFGDSRAGCDRKGNDVSVCSASENALREPAQRLWAKTVEADRLSCLDGIKPTYGPVTQLHSCLAGRAG